MPVQDSPLTKKLGVFVSLSDSDMSVLAGLHRRRRTFPAGHDLVFQGESHDFKNSIEVKRSHCGIAQKALLHREKVD